MARRFSVLVRLLILLGFMVVSVSAQDPDAFGHLAHVKSAVVTVDQWVGLTTKQYEALTTALTKRWKTQGLPLSAATLHAGLPPGFPEKEVRDLLTPDQQRLWKLVRAENQKPVMLDLATGETKPLSEPLKRIAESRTVALASQFSLTPNQLKRFRLASKGAVPVAVRKRLEAQRHVTSSDGGKLDPRLFECWACDQASLLVCHSKWTRYVRSVLNPEQRKTYDATMQFRAAKAHEALLHYLIAVNAANVGIKEPQKLLDFLSKEIPVDPRGLKYSVKTVDALGSLDTSTLEKTDAPDVASAFVAVFRRGRTVFKKEAAGSP